MKRIADVARGFKGGNPSSYFLEMKVFQDVFRMEITACFSTCTEEEDGVKFETYSIKMLFAVLTL